MTEPSGDNIEVINLHDRSAKSKKIFQWDLKFKTLFLLLEEQHILLPYIDITFEKLSNYKKLLKRLNMIITFL